LPVACRFSPRSQEGGGPSDGVPAHAASFSAGGVLVRVARLACLLFSPHAGRAMQMAFRAAGDINGYDYFRIKSVVEFVLKK
jgi:hypothetical protein